MAGGSHNALHVSAVTFFHISVRELLMRQVCHGVCCWKQRIVRRVCCIYAGAAQQHAGLVPAACHNGGTHRALCRVGY
jgi:hypothetical protein